MSVNVLKEKAVSLRKSGLTYTEICQKLGYQVPKGTMSYWCKNIELAPELKEKLRRENLKHLDRVRAKALGSNRLKRAEYLEGLRRDNLHLVEKIDRDTAKVALAMLYLGEGSKWKSHSGLQLGNSDPKLIRLYINLLDMCYDISRSKLRARISYRADQDIEELQRYWSSETGLESSQFYNTTPDKRTIGKETKRQGYKGVCVISGGGTKPQLELQTIAEIISMGP
jgi:hypothetical protein